MPRRISAKRYAQAVLLIAQERNESNEWMNDLGLLNNLFANKSISDVLDSPQIPIYHKLGLVSQTMKDMVGPLAINLVSLLATQNLVHLLAEIAKEYEHLLNHSKGLAIAEVVSAIPLDTAQNPRVEKTLSTIVGKKIKLISIVDPTILGGLVAQIGDKVLDGSVRGKIEAMRHSVVKQAT